MIRLNCTTIFSYKTNAWKYIQKFSLKLCFVDKHLTKYKDIQLHILTLTSIQNQKKYIHRSHMRLNFEVLDVRKTGK
jgi:hypothetical protein